MGSILLIIVSYFVLSLFWNNDRWLRHGLQFNIATLGLLTTMGGSDTLLNLYNKFSSQLSSDLLSTILIIQYFSKSRHTQFCNVVDILMALINYSLRVAKMTEPRGSSLSLQPSPSTLPALATQLQKLNNNCLSIHNTLTAGSHL